MEIKYSKQVLKFLKKQDVPSQKRLLEAIGRLPDCGDVKKLQGRGGYRLRVGSYRIIFSLASLEVLCIEKIHNRGQVYR